MAELSVAIIGCDSIGVGRLHCWVALSGVRIAALCDTDGVTVARLAAQMGEVPAFTDFRRALASGPFDIVDVCAPSVERAAVVEAALRAGSNVVCEMPLTDSVEKASALAQLASDRERLLMPAFHHRFHPLLLFAKDLVDNDDLGRPTMFRCRLSGIYADGRREVGLGGALMQTALHGIDLFRAFCGEARSASGSLAKAAPGAEAEDTVALMLAGDNRVGVVEASWSDIGAYSVVEIYGTAGACLLDYELGAQRYLTADQPFWQTRDESPPHRVERMVSHFADAVRGLQPLLVTADDAVRAIELCQLVKNG